jgi:hypothetical protein
MQHPVHYVRYSVVPINFSLSTITSHSSVITTLIYNDKILGPFRDVTEFDLFCLLCVPTALVPKCDGKSVIIVICWEILSP